MIKSILLVVVSTVVSMSSGLVVTAIVANIFGPEGSGIVSLVVWLSMSAVTVIGFGMPQGVLKFSAEPSSPQARAILSYALYPFAGAAVVLAALLFVAAASIGPGAGEAGAWLLRAGAVYFLVYFFFVYATAAAQSRGRFSETTVSTTIGSLVQVPAAIIGGLVAGVPGALVGMATRYLPQVVLLPRYLLGQRTGIGPQLRRKIRSYGHQIWLTDIIDLVALSRIELLVLGLFYSLTQTGYFAIAIALFGIVGQVSLQLSSPMIVGFSKDNAADNGPQVIEVLDSAIWGMAVVFCPVALGGAAIMPALLPIVFGAEFVPAIPAAMILLAASLASALAVVPWGFLAAVGRSDLLLRCMLKIAVISMLMLFALVPPFGVLGAAVARFVAEFLFLAMLLLALDRQALAGIDFAVLARIAVAGLGCACPAYVAVQVLPGLLGIGIAVVMGAVVYLAGLRILRIIRPRERAWILAQAVPRMPVPLRPASGALVRLIAGE